MAMRRIGGVGKECLSSPSSEQLECCGKSICFLAYNMEKGHRLEFYSVQKDDCEKKKKKKKKKRKRVQQEGEEEGPVLSPMTSKNLPMQCKHVALGSTIYMLGGLPDVPDEELDGPLRLSRKVRSFDVSRPQEGWKKHAKMINGRTCCAAVALNGKIYVFGGADLECAPDPWAEVFDPVRGKWKRLPPPPKRLLLSGLFAGAIGHNRILVGSTSSIVYDASKNTWEEVSPKSVMNVVSYFHSPKPLSVGNTLYWLRPDGLYAYYADVDKACSGKIKGAGLKSVFTGDDIFGTPPLLHLGGDEFCFLTADHVPCSKSKTGWMTLLRCTTFEVSEHEFYEGHIGFLKASVRSIKYYHVYQGLIFKGGLVLNVMRDGIKKIEAGSASKEVVEEELVAGN